MPLITFIFLIIIVRDREASFLREYLLFVTGRLVPTGEWAVMRMRRSVTGVTTFVRMESSTGSRALWSPLSAS